MGLLKQLRLRIQVEKQARIVQRTLGRPAWLQQIFCVGVRKVFAKLRRQADETFCIEVCQVIYKGKLTICPLLSPQFRRAHLEQNYF